MNTCFTWGTLTRIIRGCYCCCYSHIKELIVSHGFILLTGASQCHCRVFGEVVRILNLRYWNSRGAIIKKLQKLILFFFLYFACTIFGWPIISRTEQNSSKLYNRDGRAFWGLVRLMRAQKVWLSLQSLWGNAPEKMLKFKPVKWLQILLNLTLSC